MRVLSLAILFLILATVGRAQDSPHGSDFKINCKDCHSAKGWGLDRNIYSFDHNSTRLPLEGQHLAVNCKSCHPTLIFSESLHKMLKRSLSHFNELKEFVLLVIARPLAQNFVV